MLGIITEVIGPVLLITAVGYALGRSRLVPAQPLTALSALVLIPALVFYALTTSTLPRAAFARIGSFIVVQFLLVAFVVWVFAPFSSTCSPSTSAPERLPAGLIPPRHCCGSRSRMLLEQACS